MKCQNLFSRKNNVCFYLYRSLSLHCLCLLRPVYPNTWGKNGIVTNSKVFQVCSMIVRHNLPSHEPETLEKNHIFSYCTKYSCIYKTNHSLYLK